MNGIAPHSAAAAKFLARRLQEQDLLGWATERLVELDALAPGLIRRLLRSSPLVRQAIFAAVAQTMNWSDSKSHALAGAILTGKARTILAVALGSCPEGLMGALERVGRGPLPRACQYSSLINIFTDPEKRGRAGVLRYCGPVTDVVVEAASRLDIKWLRPNVLTRATNLQELADFIEALRYLQTLPHGPSDDAVRMAIDGMGERARLETVVSRLVLRAGVFPEFPLNADEDFEPLRTGTDLVRAGRKFRNCLRHQILAATIGRSAFAIYRGEAVVEFRRLHGSAWIMLEIYGPSNDRVPRSTRTAIREACERHHIHMFAIERTAELQPLLRMAGDGIYH